MPKEPSKPPQPEPARSNTTPVFVTAADKVMPANDIVQMFAHCISHTTGNTDKVDLEKTLQPYGFDTQHQVDTFTGFIIGSADFGVKHFGFTLAAGSLTAVKNTTQLSDVLILIQNKAVLA